MADNTQVTAGAGDVMRSVDHAGVKTQLVGLDLNPAGAEVKQSAAALADGTANPTIPLWAMCGMLYNGTTWDRIRGDTTNGIDVDVTRLPALPTGANTIGKVDQGAGGASAWKTDGSAVTQPVSLASVPTVTEKQDQPASSSATWTSATALNTAVTVATTGYGTANISIQVPSTVTAGVVTLEVSDDAGTTYYPAGAVRVDNGLQENIITLALSPGIASGRMWAASVDAMTQIRARLSTVIVGAGNVLVRVGTVGSGIEPFVATRPRKVATYRAIYRLATRPYHLSSAFGAAGRKQYATIHHAAVGTKLVKLKRVLVNIDATSAATFITADLVRITTAPATGNPAITPAPASGGLAAAESTCLALPTTAATEAGIFSTLNWTQGITSATNPTAQPVMPIQWWDLIATSSALDDETQAPEIRPGVLEGWAVTVDVANAATITGNVMIEFTEEVA